MDGASTRGSGGGAGRTLSRLLMTLVVLALLGTVAMLLSQLNARTYMVQRQGDTLVIMKGRQLPYGVAPFSPGDPSLADTYGPIPLGGKEPGPELLGGKFEDRESLDRALFGLLEGLARPKLDSENPEQLDQAVYYLRRAAKLRGLSDAQRLTLTRLQSEVAYYQAKKKLDEARRLLLEAVEQLREATQFQGRDSREALALLSQVEPLARGLEAQLGEAHRRQTAGSNTVSPAAPAAVNGATPTAPDREPSLPPPSASPESDGGRVLVPLPDAGGASSSPTLP